MPGIGLDRGETAIDVDRRVLAKLGKRRSSPSAYASTHARDADHGENERKTASASGEEHIAFPKASAPHDDQRQASQLTGSTVFYARDARFIVAQAALRGDRGVTTTGNPGNVG
jgi:hypothetical protein